MKNVRTKNVTVIYLIDVVMLPPMPNNKSVNYCDKNMIEVYESMKDVRISDQIIKFYKNKIKKIK